jgi:hypothetical protein
MVFPLAFALAFPLAVAAFLAAARLRPPEVALGGRLRRGAAEAELAAVVETVLGLRLGLGTTLSFPFGSSEGFSACVASGSCELICSGCCVSHASYRTENSSN